MIPSRLAQSPLMQIVRLTWGTGDYAPKFAPGLPQERPENLRWADLYQAEVADCGSHRKQASGSATCNRAIDYVVKLTKSSKLSATVVRPLSATFVTQSRAGSPRFFLPGAGNPHFESRAPRLSRLCRRIIRSNEAHKSGTGRNVLRKKRG